MSLANIFNSVAGQENEDLSANEIIATAEEAAEAVVEAEIKTAEADIAEAEKDIESHDVAIEALEDKVEELEEIIEGNEAMMSGATAFNAGLFADRMARGAKILAKFGAPIEVKGAESYADASTANIEAYAGMESIKATAGKAVATIKKFFIELYNSFISLFVGLFNRLKGIKNKASVVKAKVQKAEKVKDEVSFPKSAALLNKDGGFNYSALIAVGGKVYSELQDLGVANEDDSAKAVHSIADSFSGIGTKSIEGKTDSSETLTISLAGGATVKIVAPTKDAGLGKVNVTVTAGEKADVNKLEKGKLIELCNSVASNADKLQNAKLDKSALTTQRDRAIGVMEKRAAEAGTEKKDSKAAVGAVKAAHRDGLKLGKAATALGADALEAQLALVSAHV